MIRAICFDIGETLVDETRHWLAIAAESGVPALTLLGVLGGVAARGDHHTRVFTIVGIEPIDGPDYESIDLYPDALPCLSTLKERGYLIGLAGNQPARTEVFLHQLGVDVDLVASSATWGVEKPSPGFFDRLAHELDLEPSQIAYVGDRVDNDIVPVKVAGMVAVHIRRGPWGFLHDPADADIRLLTLSDLPAALEALQANNNQEVNDV